MSQLYIPGDATVDTFEISGRNETPFTFSLSASVDLRTKTVLAFGGAGALAEPFLYAAALCGAEIAIVDLPPATAGDKEQFEKRLSQVGRNLADLAVSDPLVMLGNLTVPEDVSAVADAVVARFGKVDIAVNFAGRHHRTFDLPREDVAEITQIFRQVVDVNLTGAFVFTAILAQVMAQQRAGHLIHLCSSGSRLSLYGSYAYTASKHGVEGLVKTAATQLSPYGVRVNAVAPGTVVTDLNRHLSFTDDGQPKPRAKSILAHTPTKRFASAEGVAETLLSMCVEQRHLTGNIIFPDDGYIVEGHSWPEGNEALYDSAEALNGLFAAIDADFPPKTRE